MSINIVSFARETLNASACAAKMAHAALALPLPLFRALAAEYTRLANSGEYAAVRRALAHQSNALRQGCQSHSDLSADADGYEYVHCIRADRTGLRKGEYRFVVAEYKRDETKARAASAKANKAGDGNGDAGDSTDATPRATAKSDALIAELRAKLAKAESERDAARAECAKLRAELDKAAQTIVALSNTPARPATRTRRAA